MGKSQVASLRSFPSMASVRGGHSGMYVREAGGKDLGTGHCLREGS